MLNIEQVKEIIAQNKQGKKVSSLEDFAVEVVAEPEKDFNKAMGQESLTRFDQPRKSKNKNKNRNRNKAKTSDVAANTTTATNERPRHKQKPQGKKPNIIQKKNEDKK